MVHDYNTLRDKCAARYKEASAANLYGALGHIMFCPMSECGKCDALLAETSSRLHQLEGFKMAADEPTWKLFSERPPDPTTPVYVRERLSESYFTWLLGSIAQPQLMQKIKTDIAENRPAEWQWMCIPD